MEVIVLRWNAQLKKKLNLLMKAWFGWICKVASVLLPLSCYHYNKGSQSQFKPLFLLKNFATSACVRAWFSSLVCVTYVGHASAAWSGCVFINLDALAIPFVFSLRRQIWDLSYVCSWSHTL
jgi:hypothetical protein